MKKILSVFPLLFISLLSFAAVAEKSVYHGRAFQAFIEEDPQLKQVMRDTKYALLPSPIIVPLIHQLDFERKK